MPLPRFIYRCDDPLICMGAIDNLSKLGFVFKVEHIDGQRRTASHEFINMAFYLRRNAYFNKNSLPSDLQIYFSELVEYTKQSKWRDLGVELEEEFGCSFTDILFVKNGKCFSFDPEQYGYDLESYADFIANLASSRSCRVIWSKPHGYSDDNMDDDEASNK